MKVVPIPHVYLLLIQFFQISLHTICFYTHCHLTTTFHSAVDTKARSRERYAVTQCYIARQANLINSFLLKDEDSVHVHHNRAQWFTWSTVRLLVLA